MHAVADDQPDALISVRRWRAYSITGWVLPRPAVVELVETTGLISVRRWRAYSITAVGR